MKSNEEKLYEKEEEPEDGSMPPLIAPEDLPPRPRSLMGYLDYWESLSSKLINVARRYQRDSFIYKDWYERKAQRCQALEQQYNRLATNSSKSNDAISQSLGKALGYPWFKDDQDTFPGATAENGVCVGDHVAESIAEEAARRIIQLTRRNEDLEDELRAWRHAGE